MERKSKTFEAERMSAILFFWKAILIILTDLYGFDALNPKMNSVLP